MYIMYQFKIKEIDSINIAQSSHPMWATLYQNLMKQKQ